MIGSRRHVDGGRVLARDHRNTANVVAVFMGYDYGTDPAQVELESPQAAIRLPRTEATIDEQMRLPVADNSGIATAAAAQRRKPQHGRIR